jgi:hypothetical protein
MAAMWPMIRIGGRRIPYVPVTLILILLGTSKKKNKSLTEKGSQEKI